MTSCWMSLTSFTSVPLPMTMTTAPINSDASTAMMAMTTSSSMSVKARRRGECGWSMANILNLVAEFARIPVLAGSCRNSCEFRYDQRQGSFLRVAQAFQQGQERHEQGDDDGADDEAQDDDHDRLEQADQRF